MNWNAYADHVNIYSGVLPPCIVPALERHQGGGTFADVGAGDGSVLRALVEGGYLRQFSRLRAVDVSQVRTERLRSALPAVDAQVGDAEHLPFEDASIDFYFSDQVIEHVEDDVAMANECARVMRRGGSACVGSVLKRPGAWYFYRANGTWAIDPTHRREYTSSEEYAALFTQAGLEVERISIEPIRYMLGDLVIRFLLRFGMSSESGIEAYERWSLLRVLQKLRLTIPRYFLITAVLRKTA